MSGTQPANPHYEYYGIEYYGPVKRAIRRLTRLNPNKEVPGSPGVLYDIILDSLAIDVFVKTAELKALNKIRNPRGLLFKVLVKVVVDYLEKTGDTKALVKITPGSKLAFDSFWD